MGRTSEEADPPSWSLPGLEENPLVTHSKISLAIFSVLLIAAAFFITPA